MHKPIKLALKERKHPKLICKIILIAVIGMFVTVSIFGKSVEEKDHEKSPNSNLLEVKSNIKKDTTAYRMNKEIFINVLVQANNSHTSWISRKEIAAWSATALYFSIVSSLAGIFYQKKLSMKQKRIISIFLFVTLFLFCFFVHQQIGDFANEASYQTAANKYVFKTIENNSIPLDFDFAYNTHSSFPKEINDEAKANLKIIRHVNIFCKPFVPFIYIFKKIFGNQNISHVELQESLLYDMMLIAAIFMFFILRDENSKKKKGGN